MEKKVTQKKTTSNKTTKPKSSDKKVTTKQHVKKKSNFDIHAPLFKTKMEYVYKWLEFMDETYNDPNDEWLSWDEYMVWAPWLRDVEFYKSNNIPWTLLSCHERIQMGIYDPTTKKSLDDNDKP